jgi:HAE1 family hydrophobic/amphiphilic exporter-1
MTSFAFILGCVPLWTAVGAGAVGRRILGTVVIGGMLADTLIASLFISVSFYVSERFSRRPGKEMGQPTGVAAIGTGGDRGGSPDRQGEPVTAPVRADGAPGDSPHTGAHP